MESTKKGTRRTWSRGSVFLVYCAYRVDTKLIWAFHAAIAAQQRDPHSAHPLTVHRQLVISNLSGVCEHEVVEWDLGTVRYCTRPKKRGKGNDVRICLPMSCLFYGKKVCVARDRYLWARLSGCLQNTSYACAGVRLYGDAWPGTGGLKRHLPFLRKRLVWARETNTF
jgi:hypothetical protein